MSFAPPFWDEFTTSAPSSRATRVSPPGSTRGLQPSPRNTNGRRSMCRGANLPALDDGRMRGQHHHPLRDPRARVGDHRRPGRLDLRARGARRDQHADAAVAGPRLQHQLVEHVQRFLELPGLGEVVGRHRAQHRLLAEVEADHRLDVGVRELVVGDARPVLVDEPQQPAPHRLDQQPAEVGIQPVRVRAAVDHVDPAVLAQPAREQPQVVAAQLQLARLDERDAELAREPGVLPVGRVVLAVGQDRRLRRAAAAGALRGGGAQRVGEQVDLAVQRPRHRLRRGRRCARAAPAASRADRRSRSASARCPRAPATRRWRRARCPAPRRRSRRRSAAVMPRISGSK